MSNTNITIEQAVSAARQELDSMIFRLGDPNYVHADRAAQLLRAVEQVYQQARQKAEEDALSAAAAEDDLSASAEASPLSGETEKDGEPDYEQTERECEA